MTRHKTKIIISLLLAVTLIQNVAAGAIKEVSEKADSTSFLGIKKSRSAQILDNFKDKEKELIFETVPFTSEDESILFDKESKMGSITDIAARLENSKEQYKEQKREVTKQKLTLKSYIAEIDGNIADSEKAIEETRQEISINNEKISEFMENILSLETKISSNKSSLLEYLTYIYSKGDMVYGEDNELDIVRSIILNDGNLSDIINDIHFKSVIEVAGQNFIEIHRNLVREYYYNKEMLKKEKSNNIRLKVAFEQKIKELDSEKINKQQLLEETKNQEALFNQYISARQARVDEAKGRLQDLDADYLTAYSTIGQKYNCPSFEPGKTEIDSSILELAKADKVDKCTQIKLFYYLEKQLRDSSLNA
jgi:peptidoglycan hydrolase CwlO-like protein